MLIVFSHWVTAVSLVIRIPRLSPIEKKVVEYIPGRVVVTPVMPIKPEVDKVGTKSPRTVSARPIVKPLSPARSPSMTKREHIYLHGRGSVCPFAPARSRGFQDYVREWEKRWETARTEQVYEKDGLRIVLKSDNGTYMLKVEKLPAKYMGCLIVTRDLGGGGNIRILHTPLHVIYKRIMYWAKDGPEKIVGLKCR